MGIGGGTAVYRFAPSPNGLLHLGHAYSALLNQALARRSGGRFLLRIEDIDTTRARPEFEAALLRDLGWLGVAWDGPVRRQAEHFPDYEAALARLQAMGLVYPAFLSRAAIAAAAAAPGWPRDPDGAPLYPGADRDLPQDEAAGRIGAGAAYALRLRMAEAVAMTGPLTWRELGEGPDGETGTVSARPQDWGDVILARKEIATSYHLSVVADDALQGITEVVRGRDLFHATSVHRLLQALLGLPAPAYRHHRLVLGPDGRKLSKSAGATGIAALREAGAAAQEVRRLAGFSEADI